LSVVETRQIVGLRSFPQQLLTANGDQESFSFWK
jgi:hypothetical protein